MIVVFDKPRFAASKQVEKPLSVIPVKTGIQEI